MAFNKAILLSEHIRHQKGQMSYEMCQNYHMNKKQGKGSFSMDKRRN